MTKELDSGSMPLKMPQSMEPPGVSTGTLGLNIFKPSGFRASESYARHVKAGKGRLVWPTGSLPHLGCIFGLQRHVVNHIKWSCTLYCSKRKCESVILNRI